MPRIRASSPICPNETIQSRQIKSSMAAMTSAQEPTIAARTLTSSCRRIEPQLLHHRTRRHDLWSIANVTGFYVLSAGVVARDVPEQSRLDRLAEADRTACGRCGASGPRPWTIAPSRNSKRHTCEQRSRPTDCHASAVSETARTLPAWDSGHTRWLATRPPRPSLVDPLPLSAAEFINTAAGRLPPSAERPAHTKGFVSPSLFVKQPPRPTVAVMASGHECVIARTAKSGADRRPSPRVSTLDPNVRLCARLGI